jgi:surface polysaccharide O-acyltransferase-like enzyme
LFALGTLAWRQRWLERVPPAQARRWRRIAWVAVPLLPATAAATGALAGRAVDFGGGLGIAAVVYAFWEPFVAWGLIAWLLVRFCAPGAPARPLLQRWSGAAYGAFVLHAPVITGLAAAIAGWPLPAPLKFATVLVAGTALSFCLADALRRLPGVRRVL